MPTPHIAIRLSAATKTEWEAAAEAAGTNVSNFIRDAVNEKLGREALSTGPPKKRPPRGKECDRARFHRSGTFCKGCGTVVP